MSCSLIIFFYFVDEFRYLWNFLFTNCKICLHCLHVKVVQTKVSKFCIKAEVLLWLQQQLREFFVVCQ